MVFSFALILDSIMLQTIQLSKVINKAPFYRRTDKYTRQKKKVNPSISNTTYLEKPWYIWVK